eukprot:12157406-Alexandrium_andersonii.AAC.1
MPKPDVLNSIQHYAESELEQLRKCFHGIAELLKVLIHLLHGRFACWRRRTRRRPSLRCLVGA